MHTFGGTLLAIIGVFLFQTILGFVGGFLAKAMIETASMFVIPMIMLTSLQAFGVYAGIYFAAIVTPKSNLKTVTIVVLSMLTLMVVYRGLDPQLQGFTAWFWMVAVYISSCGAAVLSNLHGRSERQN
jgi:hypothetical protein